MTKLNNTTQYIDGLTTAERSINNHKEIVKLESKLEQVAEAIDPEVFFFADGTSVETQGTRAEDIISVEDERLEAAKLNNDTFNQYVEDQATLDQEQDDKIDNLDSRLTTTEGSITSNEAAITALQERDSELATSINQEQQARIEADNALTDRDSQLTVMIEDIQDDLGTINNKDAQQDGRLAALESSLSIEALDNGIFTATGNIGNTPIVPSFSTVKGFENGLAEIVSESFGSAVKPTIEQGQIEFVIEYEATGIAQQEFVIEFVRGDNSTILDTYRMEHDFSNSMKLGGGTSFITNFENGGGEYTVRVYRTTETDNFEILQSKILVKVMQVSGEQTVYDYNVVSTSGVGGTNTLEDINALNSAIGSNTVAINTEISDRTLGDSTLQTQIDSEVSNRTLGDSTLQTQIDAMIGNVANVLMPLGTIVLGTAAPTYGTWTSLGALAEGQAIIGGTTSDGAVAQHRHYMLKSTTTEGTNSVENEAPARGVNNGGDDDYSLRTNTSQDEANWSPTSAGHNMSGVVLGTQNKAYGLGVGLSVQLWRRDA